MIPADRVRAEFFPVEIVTELGVQRKPVHVETEDIEGFGEPPLNVGPSAEQMNPPPAEILHGDARPPEPRGHAVAQDEIIRDEVGQVRPESHVLRDEDDGFGPLKQLVSLLKGFIEMTQAS